MDQDSDLENGLRGLNCCLVTCRHLNPGLNPAPLVTGIPWDFLPVGFIRFARNVPTGISRLLSLPVF